MAEVLWESPGPYSGPLAISLRLLDTTGAVVAQVDGALWNELGETAQKWRMPETSRLFLDLETPDLPAGDYTVELFPYQVETLAPLSRADNEADQWLGTLVIPP